MKQFKSYTALLCVLLVAAPGVYSQSLGDRSPRLEGNSHWYSRFTEPFDPRTVPPVNISNTGRLDSLVRGGNLYLSLNDAVALALENNIDVEVSRYGYLSADANLLSARAGGAGGVNFDPVATSTLGWGHTTQVNPNTIATGGTATVLGTQRPYNFGLQQGFMSGATANLSYNNTTTTSNNFGNTFNPNTQSSLGLQVTQPLLQGFGLAFNNRNIRIAKNNVRVNDFQFQQQLNTTLNNVIGAYWNLVSAALNVDATQVTLDQAKTLYDNNKKQLEIGTMAPIDVTTAEAQVTSNETNLLVAQAAVQQAEVSLKNVISRNGLASASLFDAHIIATDRITVPSVEPVQPIQDLMAKALDSRPELGQLRIQLDNSKISLTGTRNSMLPTLNAVANFNNPAQSGTLSTIPNPVTGLVPVRSADPSFIGGYGNILSQLFGANTLGYTFSAQLTIPLRNRAAQAAYINADLNLRTQELAMQKEINQIRSDVQNAQIAVTQARARYVSAVKTRDLEEQVVEAEQKKYELGASTTYNVILRQTDLANARQSEVAALTSYALAKLQMDAAEGTILENHDVIIEEAKQGRISKAPSPIPAVTPNGATR